MNRGVASRARRIGQFSNYQPSCPPGQHWESPPSGPIQGLGECVPNRVVALRSFPSLAPSAPAAPVATPAPPPLPPAYVPPSPVVTTPAPAWQSFAAPSPTPTPDASVLPPAAVRTAAPASATCPEPWSLWWLLLAFGVGGAIGYYAAGDKPQTKKNLSRIVNAAGARIVDRGSGAVLARVLG